MTAKSDAKTILLTHTQTDGCGTRQAFFQTGALRHFLTLEWVQEHGDLRRIFPPDEKPPERQDSFRYGVITIDRVTTELWCRK